MIFTSCRPISPGTDVGVLVMMQCAKSSISTAN